MTWAEYVRTTMGSDLQKAAAEKAAIDQSTISRWLRTGKPGEAERVAAFARAYHRPVLEAFVSAGFLTSEEARVRPVAAPSLTALTNDELLELVRARMRERGELGGNTAATKMRPRGVDTGEMDIIRQERSQHSTRQRAAKKGASSGRAQRKQQDEEAEAGGA